MLNKNSQTYFKKRVLEKRSEKDNILNLVCLSEQGERNGQRAPESQFGCGIRKLFSSSFAQLG